VALRDLDEALVAAPRVASALVYRRPIEATEQVDNLVEQEARESRKKSGESLWGLGIAGWGAIGLEGGVRPLLDVAYAYEARAFAVLASARIPLSSERSDSSASLGGIAVGMRWFPSADDVTPYLGGGLAYDWLSYRLDGDRTRFAYENNGVAPYAEAGVEILRTHRARLSAGVRVDVPFFSLQPTASQRSAIAYAESTGSPVHPPFGSKWAVPISGGVTVMF
jgi:hypothetical protein